MKIFTNKREGNRHGTACNMQFEINKEKKLQQVEACKEIREEIKRVEKERESLVREMWNKEKSRNKSHLSKGKVSIHAFATTKCNRSV